MTNLKSQKNIRRLFVASCLVTALTGYCATSAADTMDTTHQFQIRPQALQTALDTFSEQSNLQLFYSTELVKGYRTKGVTGQLNAPEALETILIGSGLKFRMVDENTITLEKYNNAELNVDSLLAAAGEFVLTAAEPAEDEYTGPVEQEDLTVSGRELSSYTAISASSGTRTDTPLMETPLNIQVITNQVLKDQQVISIDQAVRNVSGVISDPGNTGGTENFTIRGFRTETLFRNGFRIDNNQGLFSGTRQLANVERIEILKGPAAILFGRVEPGGLINLVTKQPLSTPYYSLQQQFGSFDLYRTTIDATGPITEDDTLLYRLNMSYENSDSFRNLVHNKHFFIAPVLQWNISSRTQANFEFEYSNDRASYDQLGVPLFDGKVKAHPREVNLTEGNPQKSETFFGHFNWSHEFNDDWAIKHSVTVNSLNQYSSVLAVPIFLFGPDVAGVIPFSFGSNETATYATEINLTGHFNTVGLKHTLLIGGDYYRTNFTSNLFDGTTVNGVGLSFINIRNPNHPGVTVQTPKIFG